MDVPEDVAIAHFLAFPPPELLTLLRDEERMFLASAVANNRRDSRMTAEIESLCLKVNARDTLAAGKVLSAMDAKEKASAVSAFNRLLSAVDADAAGLIRVHLNNLRRNMAYVEIDWEEQARLRPQAILDTHATRCATR